MKKIIALALSLLMVCAMVVGCAANDETKPVETTTPVTEAPETTAPEATEGTEAVDPTEDVADTTAPAVDANSTEGMLTKMQESLGVQFPTMVMPVDLTDEYAVTSYMGLDSAELVKEAAVCEAMMGSQAFSVVLVRVNDAANAETVAKQMNDGINPRKWICVMADDLSVVASNDLVLLVMLSTEYAEDATSQSIVDLFVSLYGELTYTVEK